MLNLFGEETDSFHNLPKNHFGAILVDPPWKFERWSNPDPSKGEKFRSAEDHYRTMSEDELCSLPVSEVAAENSVLFMWIGWPFLEVALSVISAWGFRYKTCGFNWLKADPYRLWALEEDVYMGLGYWTRANTEPCLLATRGKPKRLNTDVRQAIVAPRRQHSRKPDGIHERIERLVAGPYLELFARQTQPGWTTWGNERTKFDRRSDVGLRMDYA